MTSNLNNHMVAKDPKPLTLALKHIFDVQIPHIKHRIIVVFFFQMEIDKISSDNNMNKKKSQIVLSNLFHRRRCILWYQSVSSCILCYVLVEPQQVLDCQEDLVDTLPHPQSWSSPAECGSAAYTHPLLSQSLLRCKHRDIIPYCISSMSVY